MKEVCVEQICSFVKSSFLKMLSQHLKTDIQHSCRCLNVSISLSVDRVIDIATDEDAEINSVRSLCQLRELSRAKLGTSSSGIQTVIFLKRFFDMVVRILEYS